MPGGTLQSVVVNPNGALGVHNTSRRFKQDIRELGDTTETLMTLRPVRFRYKVNAPDGPENYGLIAEEVNEVAPELVGRGQDGIFSGSSYTDPTNWVTPVGDSAGSPGPFGTYDMGGDAYQWVEDAFENKYRVLRGRAWDSSSSILASNAPAPRPVVPRHSTSGFVWQVSRGVGTTPAIASGTAWWTLTT